MRFDWVSWKYTQLRYFARDFDAVEVFDTLVVPVPGGSLVLYIVTLKGNIYTI